MRELAVPARGWRARILRLAGLAALSDHLERERARWFVWVPALVGAGIVTYFRLPAEPSLATALAFPVTVAALRATFRQGRLAPLLMSALLAVAMGFALAKLRAEWVRAPVLETRLRAAEVEGYVVLVEPRGTSGQRITIALASIEGLAADRMPRFARVRAMRGLPGLAPGDAVRIRATLSPPGLPAAPGGYDFGRSAWFMRLGATGYALRPPEIVHGAPPAPWTLRAEAAIERVRQDIGRRIVAAVPGEPGAIANSLITGERGGITDETTDAFRDSGLLHILSISGLHMVTMAGAVFVGLRVLFAAVPALVLRYPTKKWAAAAALAAAFAYLLISGWSVATVRSFLMIAIMFLAVMLDRPALAMRNVAASALLILVLVPESVLDVGFQMSFAAVVSLISAYEAIRDRSREAGPDGTLKKTAFFLGGIVASTLIAGFAVAPFAAYHFHRSQQYAVLANLIAIPLCNLVVMPAALASLIAMPLGLEWLPLTVMGWGIEGMVAAARFVAALPGAVVRIPAIPEIAFGLMVAGGLWLALWRRAWRWAGLAAIAAGLALAPGARRPDVLVGAGGTLAAVRGEDGRLALITKRRRAFEATRWLEEDGDARTFGEAVRGGSPRCDAAACTMTIKGALVAVIRQPSAFAEDCRRARILVAAIPAPAGCTAPATVIDYSALRRSGTHALYVEADGSLRIETAAGARGERPWALSEIKRDTWERRDRGTRAHSQRGPSDDP